jgi:hypothetical protein
MILAGTGHGKRPRKLSAVTLNCSRSAHGTAPLHCPPAPLAAKPRYISRPPWGTRRTDMSAWEWVLPDLSYSPKT